MIWEQKDLFLLRGISPFIFFKMPIEFNQEYKKKKVKANVLVKTEKIFANCKRCDRPYKKGKNYPDEVCRFCETEETNE